MEFFAVLVVEFGVVYLGFLLGTVLGWIAESLCYILIATGRDNSLLEFDYCKELRTTQERKPGNFLFCMFVQSNIFLGVACPTSSELSVSDQYVFIQCLSFHTLEERISRFFPVPNGKDFLCLIHFLLVLSMWFSLPVVSHTWIGNLLWHM